MEDLEVLLRIVEQHGNLQMAQKAQVTLLGERLKWHLSSEGDKASESHSVALEAELKSCERRIAEYEAQMQEYREITAARLQRDAARLKRVGDVCITLLQAP